MNRALFVRTVLLRIGRYRLKTALMAFGIAVGVLAMVVIQTLAGGFRDAFEAFVRRIYPTDVVVLASGGFMRGGYGAGELRIADVETLLGAIPDIADWDPLVAAGARDVTNDGNDVRVGISGHSERAEHVRRRSVSEGEFFSAAEVRSGARVALLGATTRGDLFGEASPIGATLFIDGIGFEIKGVLERAGADPHGGDLDQAVWIPFTTALDDLLNIDLLAGASFVLADPERAPSVGRRIDEIMRERRQIAPDEVPDFTVMTPDFVQRQIERAFGTLGLFVPLVIAAVFAMAGLIVVSVMLISIKQRSAEIGLRKALGARPRDLGTQILAEALIVALAAAAIGLGAAWLALDLLAPMFAERFGIARTTLEPAVAVASIAAAVATGLVAGLLPARKAARLDPIEALTR